MSILKILRVFTLGIMLIIISNLGLPTTNADTVPTTTTPDSVFHYLYSPTCPACQRMNVFLAELQNDFPDLIIEKYDLTKRSEVNKVGHLYDMYPEAQPVRGQVPAIFYGEHFFLGFNENVTNSIREAVVMAWSDTSDDKKTPSTEPKPINATTAKKSDYDTESQFFSVPWIGEVSSETFSMPILAALLGFLDGFNICSIGALLLILSIVIKLQSRKLIILYGGIFLIITASMYMLLILLWHRLFITIAPLLPAFEILVGMIALGGGVYFIREFYRFQKYGMTCQSGTGQWVASVSKTMQGAFDSGKKLSIAGAIALFASVIVIVEFPCSAAIPVTFAGMLATMNLTPIAYLSYIAIFIFFYLLVEIIVFIMAVYSMKLWGSSGRFVKGATLSAAIVLLGFGVYYLSSLF